jgi:hypothetical protein
MKPKIDHHTEPYTGPTTFDLTTIAAILVHLAKGGQRGLLRERPGIEEVITELAASVPGSGKVAGITQDLYQPFLDARGKVDKVNAVRAAIAILDQVLDDSLAVYENDAEQALRQIVDVVESNAKRKKNEAIAKPFSATVAYAKQTATKAVKTRKKNAEAKANANGKAAPAPAKAPTTTAA